MTLNIIERYLLRRMTSVFLAATISTLTIAWTVQVLNRINLVTDTGQSALDFLQLATLILPNVVPEVMPIAVAIGVAHALTTMNTDSELVVINAAGTSRVTLAKPVLVLAGAACIATFLVHNVVAPITRETVREMIAEARAGLISTLIQEGAFRRIDDNLFLQVGERRADGQLGSVFVADSRTKDVDLTYYAKTAVLGEKDGANFLAMRDGEIHRNRPGEPVSIIRFNSYVFDLAEFTPSTGKVNLWPKDRPLTYHMALTAAVAELLVAKGVVTADELRRTVEDIDSRHPGDGARVVARAWMDTAFKARLLEDVNDAAAELGIDCGGIPIRAVENTRRLHNLVVCTLCSCYPRMLIGLPPDWYKARAYRSRAVREPRAVLREFGVTLPDDVELVVHDSTADMRYLVVPARPDGTDGWSEEALAAIVTRDCMIGTALPRSDAPRSGGG